MKPLLIVNPAANGGKTREMWSELRRPIERVLGACELAFTERTGHAIDLARAAASTFDRIIAVGGDGTFSEVASGVLASGAQPAVGLIHQGTGGDFRRSLGFEHRLDRYLAATTREPRLIDAGLVEYIDRAGQQQTRRFVNVASIGMGGLVDKYVSEGTRMLGGTATYFLATLKALANGAVGNLVCDIETEEGTRTLNLQTRILAVCNGRYFGGGMEVAPRASLDDGLFDVVGILGGGRAPLVGVLSSVYNGSHLSHSSVEYFRARSISLRLVNDHDSERFLLDVDGECVGQAPVKLTVLPKALRVFGAA